MAARHTKTTKRQTCREMMIRHHHRNVRNLQDWCLENDAEAIPYKDAEEYDICVCSKSEYELHEYRKNCSPENESWFLNQEDYEKWCEQ